jgi:6-phosphogluconolactonase (cycloisomerase 2 family)
LGKLEPVGVALAETSSKVPNAVAIGKHGYAVVSGVDSKQSGSAVLKFVNPINNDVAMEVSADTGAISGLAYNAKSGNLYATVFDSQNSEEAGVYRIDDAGEAAFTAVKLASVERPTSLAFGPDDTLYVTALGKQGTEDGAGVLLKLVGEL